MSTTTDNDLRELKDLINSKFEQINEKIDNRYQLLDGKLNDMKIDIATIKSDVNGLGKRLDDTNKRIDNLEFTNRGILISIVSGLILAVITLLFKFLAPPIG
ncbi:hypothetical protein ACN4EE_13685 [Geminocystis sp. CENA526]|uniref:hypothetical protein n=1 Tax=Geminocystis sp. CENA526 TaxID=1355871 RepID=UPI003D6E8DA2